MTFDKSIANIFKQEQDNFFQQVVLEKLDIQIKKQNLIFISYYTQKLIQNR